MLARGCVLALCLVALSACQYRGSRILIGTAGAMDSLVAAARSCGVRKIRILTSSPVTPRAETRVHIGRVRVGSRSERAYDCLDQWLRARPELNIGEEILITFAGPRTARG